MASTDNKDSIRKVFSINLNKFMKERNTTQAELAEYMGVSTATANYWAKGTKIPRMDKIDRLCSFFHVKRADLLLTEEQRQQELLKATETTRDTQIQRLDQENILKIFYADNKEIMEFVDKHGFCLLGDISVFDFEGRENLKNLMLKDIRKIKQNSRDNGLLKNDNKRKE